MTTMSHFTFQHLHMSSTLLSCVRKKQNPVVNHSIFLAGLHSRVYRCLAVQPWLWSPSLVRILAAEKAMTLGMRRGVLVCSRKRKFTTCISIGNHILHAYSMSNYVSSFFTYSNHENSLYEALFQRRSCASMVLTAVLRSAWALSRARTMPSREEPGVFVWPPSAWIWMCVCE